MLKHYVNRFFVLETLMFCYLQSSDIILKAGRKLHQRKAAAGQRAALIETGESVLVVLGAAAGVGSGGNFGSMVYYNNNPSEERKRDACAHERRAQNRVDRSNHGALPLGLAAVAG